MLFLFFLYFFWGSQSQLCNVTISFDNTTIPSYINPSSTDSFDRIKYTSDSQFQYIVALSRYGIIATIDLYTKTFYAGDSNVIDFSVNGGIVCYLNVPNGIKQIVCQYANIFNAKPLIINNLTNVSSIFYCGSRNTLYAYSNVSFEIYAFNVSGNQIFWLSSSPILSDANIYFLKTDNVGKTTSIKKLAYDDIYQDLYIIVNNFVYLWSVKLKMIWCRYNMGYTNIDDILIMSDPNNGLQKFRVILFSLSSPSFFTIIQPNISMVNISIPSLPIEISVVNLGQTILSITNIFDSEYFIILFYNSTNPSNLNISVFSYDGNFYTSLVYPINNPDGGQPKYRFILGNIDHLDQFYLYNRNQNTLGTSLTLFSLFGYMPDCDTCMFNNLLFHPYLFGCSKTCGISNRIFFNKCRPFCGFGSYGCQLPCVFDSILLNPKCSTMLAPTCQNNLCQLCQNYDTTACVDCFVNGTLDVYSQKTCLPIIDCKQSNLRTYYYNDSEITICLNSASQSQFCLLSEFYNSSNLTCQLCNSNCLTCQWNSSYCTSCDNGLFLYNNTCLKNCPSNTYPDIIYNTSLSLTRYCKSNCHFMWQNQCVDLCPLGTNTTNSFCVLICNQTYFYYPDHPDFGCQKTCDALYYPNVSNGVNLCLPKCPKNLYFQINTTNYTCVNVCSNGYFNYNNESCQPCMANCSSCKNISTCDLCFDNFQYFEFHCILKNTSNDTNNTNQTIENTTIKCSDPCQTCLSSNTSICLSCNDSMVFFNNFCYVSCPMKSFQISNQNFCKACNDSNCLTCSDEYTCRSCSQNYLLNLTYCVTSCLFNEYYDPNSTLCLSCSSNCSSCFGPSPASCLSCQSPLYLKGTECKNPCNNQNQCADLNSTIDVTLLKSFTVKNSFYIVFSKDLEIPSYINLTNLVNLTLDNVDPSLYSYSIEKVDGFPDRLLVVISCNASVGLPTATINFTNYSDTYIHGKYNSSFNIGNNTIGLNITLDDIVIPTETPSTFEIKQEATSKTYQGLLGSIISMNVITYLICTKRMSLFWFLTDAMQLLSTLMFLNLNFSLRLLDCFGKMLFFHGFFLFSVGKEFNENSQKFIYFGHEISENYQTNNFVNYYLTANFIPNGLPPIFLIFLIYVVILLFKITLFLNQKVFKNDEDKGFWGLMRYIYTTQLFSILLRAHFVLMYIILISVFFQIENLSFNTSWSKYGSILAVLTLLYYFGFLLYVSTRLCNSKEVYENDELICAYECVFYDLEVFSFIRRNHFLMIQIKKFFVVVVLVVFVQYQMDDKFLIFLVVVQVFSILRYVKWRPFQNFKLSLINVLTEIWVLLVIITVIKIQNTTINSSNGVISNDSLKEIESNGDATASLIILLLGGYFFLSCVIFIYYFCKNIDCICYVCFNIKNDEYKKNAEEDDEKNKSIDNSKSVLEQKPNRLKQEYSPVHINNRSY